MSSALLTLEEAAYRSLYQMSTRTGSSAAVQDKPSDNDTNLVSTLYELDGYLLTSAFVQS